MQGNVKTITSQIRILNSNPNNGPKKFSSLILYFDHIIEMVFQESVWSGSG